MSKANNLTDFLTSLATTIRTKKGYATTQKINPQDFDEEIRTITTVNNQDKTATPSTTKQTITADSGYTGIGTMTINAMPSGSATGNAGTITYKSHTQDSTDKKKFTVTGTVTAPAPTVGAGYVASGTAGTSTDRTVSLTITAAQAQAAVGSGSATGNAGTLSNTTFTQDSTDKKKFNISTTVSAPAPTVSAGYVASGTAGSGVSRSTSITISAAQAQAAVGSGSATGTNGTVSQRTAADAFNTSTGVVTVGYSIGNSTPSVSAGYISSGTAGGATTGTLTYTLSKANAQAFLGNASVSSAFTNSGLSTYFDSGTSSSKDVTITPNYSITTGGYAAATSSAQAGTASYYKIKALTLPTSADTGTGSTYTQKAIIYPSTTTDLYLSIGKGWNNTESYYKIPKLDGGFILVGDHDIQPHVEEKETQDSMGFKYHTVHMYGDIYINSSNMTVQNGYITDNDIASGVVNFDNSVNIPCVDVYASLYASELSNYFDISTASNYDVMLAADCYINNTGYVEGGTYSDAQYFKAKTGSATTPATTITATLGDPTYDSISGKYTISASGSKDITPTVASGFINGGTAGKISVNGVKPINKSVFQEAHDSEHEEPLAFDTIYEWTQGYHGSTEYFYVPADLTLNTALWNPSSTQTSGSTISRGMDDSDSFTINKSGSWTFGVFNQNEDTNYSATFNVTACTLPTSTSATASGTSKATIAASTGTRYINIPAGYNDTASYYTLSAMPSMTLPTSAATSASGSIKATITPKTSAQYINIPTGYNSAAAYYTIPAVGQTNLTAANIAGGVNVKVTSNSTDLYNITGTHYFNAMTSVVKKSPTSGRTSLSLNARTYHYINLNLTGMDQNAYAATFNNYSTSTTYTKFAAIPNNTRTNCGSCYYTTSTSYTTTVIINGHWTSAATQTVYLGNSTTATNYNFTFTSSAGARTYIIVFDGNNTNSIYYNVYEIQY